MTLTQLRYFQAVCRFHSVTQASDFLHISQPSISSAIRDLEQEFGVVLFLRQYRGMSLTEEGLHFLELADSLLAHADQVRQAMADIGQKRRQFQLGIPPMIGSTLRRPVPGLRHPDLGGDHPRQGRPGAGADRLRPPGRLLRHRRHPL